MKISPMSPDLKSRVHICQQIETTDSCVKNRCMHAHVTIGSMTSRCWGNEPALEPVDSQIHYALFLALVQNWVAYQTLEKAAELNITQQRINFENDDVLPKPGYHNAFCQVRNSLHQLWKESDLNLNMN